MQTSLRMTPEDKLVMEKTFQMLDEDKVLPSWYESLLHCLLSFRMGLLHPRIWKHSSLLSRESWQMKISTKLSMMGMKMVTTKLNSQNLSISWTKAEVFDWSFVLYLHQVYVSGLILANINRNINAINGKTITRVVHRCEY